MSLISILDGGGNVIDCCAYSLLSALIGFKSDRGRLSLNFFPIFCSFSFFPPDIVVSDPNADEKLYSKGDLTLAIDPNTGEVCSLFKRGHPVQTNLVSQCLSAALRQSPSILSHIRANASQ